MRKHWLVSAAAAIAAAAGGVSYASLTDSVDSSQEIAAATLTVGLQSGGTGNVAWGTFGPLAPQIDGNIAAEVKTVVVKNKGTVPATVHFQAIELVSNEARPGEEACVPPERTAEQGECGSAGELPQQLQVEVINMPTGSGTAPKRLGFMSLGTLAATEHDTGLVLTANQTARLQFEFLLPETPELDSSGNPVTEQVSNAVQGDTATFKMRFSLRSV